MLSQDYPILEHDPSREAIIEPGKIFEHLNVPESCVVCFFQEVIDNLTREGKLSVLFTIKTEIGEHPVYELQVDGERVAVVHPGLGASMAAIFLEESIARGCTKFIACGGCGVLDKAITVGHLLVPISAVRDEGTSYHYLPPSREVEPTPKALASLENVLDQWRIEYMRIKAWTTDGIYRETPEKAALRLWEGCLAVEMEAAAFFAVARFRGVEFAQVLYGGDMVVSEGWDSRGWVDRMDVRERLFWLSVEAALSI